MTHSPLFTKHYALCTLHSALCTLPFALCTILLTSCHIGSWEPPYTTSDVAITISPRQVSAGFAEVEFSTDRDAYYLVGIQPVDSTFDLSDKRKQFMIIATQRAMSDYLAWSNELLYRGEFFISDFASHSLRYGRANIFFNHLTPGTDYWVYAFVVDPKTKEHAGSLFVDTIHTCDSSTIDVHFDYRVSGRWDYIYPMDENGYILSNFPYVAATVDSLLIAERGLTAEDFFVDSLQTLQAAHAIPVLYGVYTHNNDGRTGVRFEPGHTYYTAIAGLDGALRQHAIYRFIWLGDSTEYSTDYFAQQ